MTPQIQWLFEALPNSKATSPVDGFHSNSEIVSYDRFVQHQHQQMLERQSDFFVVENRLLKIPPGHETLNFRAAKGLHISSTELAALNQGVRRVDTEKLLNHFKPSQQRRHMLRRYKCQHQKEALKEARQQLTELHAQALRAPRREVAFTWIGEALHLIQDSYSPAHTEREAGGTGAIKFIRYYHIDGRSYPQEHRVFPMRQPGRRLPLPVDVRDYINHSGSVSAAATSVTASREFLQMMLYHLQSLPPGFSGASWNAKRRKDLLTFMNKYLVLSPHYTPTKTIYPRECP